MRSKLVLKIVLAVFLLIVFLSANSIFAFYYYKTGKTAFYKEDYKGAAVNFKKAVDKNPNNLDYRYYYAESLANLSNTTDAVIEFEKIVKMSPQSEIANLSLGELRKIDEKIYNQKLKITSFARNQDNYVNSVTYNGKIIRWNLEELPLKLYIDKSGASNTQISLVKKAFDYWINSLDGLLTYKIVNNNDKADIIISFTNKTSIYKDNDGNGEASAGITNHHIEDNLLKYVTIKISTLDLNQKPASDDKIYTVLLHELGHALGIGAHSYYKADIMYPLLENRIRFEDIHLSHRDINTVKLLYKLDADVSNFDPKNATNKHNLNSVILGGEKSRFENELQEAKNYNNTTPNNPHGWVRLGEAYHNVKQYQEAISCFKKALEFNPNYDLAREGLAFVYIDMNQIDNSADEFRKLILADPENIGHSSNLALLYIKNNRYNDARKIINALVAVNPRALNDENIKNIISALDNKNIKLKISSE